MTKQFFFARYRLCISRVVFALVAQRGSVEKWRCVRFQRWVDARDGKRGVKAQMILVSYSSILRFSPALNRESSGSISSA
jgi:hypothetical protein